MTKFFESMENIKLGDLSLATICSTIILLVICIIVRKIVLRIFCRAIGRTKMEAGLKSFLSAAAGIIMWIIIALIVADSFGIPMTSLVALLSVVSLALSLSVQNILENLFSGMTILSTKPFTVGNYVEMGTTAGTVSSVGLFYTVLTTPDGKAIHVPNRTVTGSTLTNFSANTRRRIDVTVSASYDDSTDKVKAALQDALGATEGILQDPEPMVGVSDYGDSAIKYSIWAWCDTGVFIKTKFSLMENIRDAFERHGVTMTYNHLNVHLTGGESEK